MRLFNIRELEEESGLPRTTIYHYLKKGLVPAAQRSGGGPAVYSSRHLTRISRIQELKAAGLTLEEIRSRLEADEPEKDVDLVRQQEEAIRATILKTAAAQFTEKGYRNTRMADIAAASAIGPLTLYRYFAAKRELFIEVVDLLVERALKYTESLILPESDEVRRHLLRVRGFLEVRDISREMLTFIRAEALLADPDARQFFIRTYQSLTRALVADLRSLREQHGSDVHSSDEMMGYALLGVMEETAMRLLFDERYGVEDYLWTNLEAYLPIHALYCRQVKEWVAPHSYSPLVAELASGPLFTF